MFVALDRILRGGFTDADRLVGGRIDLPLGMLIRVSLLLGMAYGVMMGTYALFAWDNMGEAAKQVVSTTFKVPLLFLLTLVITFPSLYVLSALARTRLGAADTGRLLLVVLAVSMALLASLGPITVFFTLSTDSYPFMVVLNVLFFAVAGVVGLSFMYRSLAGLLAQDAHGEDMSGSLSGDAPEEENAQWAGRQGAGFSAANLVTRNASRTRKLFAGWCVLFAVVGSQMGWVLRPFIGHPDLPFELFRARQANFVKGVLNALQNLFA